jgi:hypothetical protein
VPFLMFSIRLPRSLQKAKSRTPDTPLVRNSGFELPLNTAIIDI